MTFRILSLIMYSDKGNTENRKGEKEMMNNDLWNMGNIEDMMREAGITAEELFGEEKEEEGD